MSKSYNNCIYLSDSVEEIRRKVKNMITDPVRIHPTDMGHPNVCPVFVFHQSNIAVVKQQCQETKRGCVMCKEELTQILIKYIHESRKELEKDTQKIINILNDGKEEAREITLSVLLEVRKAMKIW